MPYVRKYNRMPRKTTNKKPLAIRRKPIYRRRARTIGGFRPQGGTSIPRGVFPLTVMKKLRYCEDVSINAGIAARDYHAFHCNNLYDPSYSGVGHQPRGFDQMAQFYEHYTVVGAKITVKRIVDLAVDTATQPAMFWLTMSTSANPLSVEANDFSIFESGMIRNYKYIRGGSDGSLALPSVTSTFSAKKFFGAKSLVGVTPYRAPVTGAPDELAFFSLYVQTPYNGTVEPPAYRFHVTIDYLAVFTEPKQIGSS